MIRTNPVLSFCALLATVWSTSGSANGYCGHQRCLDVTQNSKKIDVYKLPDKLGDHYLVHNLGHPDPVPVIGMKDANDFDTFALITLDKGMPDNSLCTPDPNSLLGNGTKVFIQSEGSGPTLYVLKDGKSLELPMKPVQADPNVSGSDVLSLQTKAPSNGLDYFVYFEDTTGCKGARFIHVEAYPSSSGGNVQCFAERPEWKKNPSPPSKCPKEVGSGSGNEPDHPR